MLDGASLEQQQTEVAFAWGGADLEGYGKDMEKGLALWQSIVAEAADMSSHPTLYMELVELAVPCAV